MAGIAVDDRDEVKEAYNCKRRTDSDTEQLGQHQQGGDKVRY